MAGRLFAEGMIFRQLLLFSIASTFDGKRERENSKTLFYKDCSLGSVKNLSNN